MNTLFPTDSPVPTSDTEPTGVSGPLFGALLMFALVGAPLLLRVLNFVPLV